MDYPLSPSLSNRRVMREHNAETAVPCRSLPEFPGSIA